MFVAVNKPVIKKLSAEVCVVMVTFNRCELLKEAIEALKTQTVPLGGICIVNNASTDGTKDWLDTQESLHVIHMEENTGGAGGFHIGTKHAVELNYDFCWLLDDDAVATSTALEELLKFHIDHTSDYGFLCSNVISNESEPMNVPSISTKTNATGYLDWPRFLKYGVIEVDSCTFVSCFIPAKVVKDVGLPIKEMFIWGDDTEYTTRISIKYHCFMVSSSVVNHKRVQAGSLSILKEEDPNRIKMYFNMYRNSLYVKKVYGTKKQLLKFFVISFITTPVKIILNSKSNKLLRLVTLFKGLISGLFFKPKIIKIK